MDIVVKCEVVTEEDGQYSQFEITQNGEYYGTEDDFEIAIAVAMELADAHNEEFIKLDVASLKE